MVPRKVIEDEKGAGVWGGLAPIKKALPPRSGRAITYPVLFSGRSPGCRSRHRVDKPEIVSITL